MTEGVADKTEGLADKAGHEYAVLDRRIQFTGPMFSIVTDDVAMPGGTHAARDFMRHVGAVGVVAVDDEDNVVLVRQYRHPVGAFLWELPAGLIDVAGEPLRHAAARELAEEADLVAEHWRLLLDIHPTPGSSNEIIRLFVARGLSPVPEKDRHHREHEEAELSARRLPLDEAAAMIGRGEITNAAAIAGVLATVRLRDAGWPEPARPMDAPLPPRRT